MRLRTALVLVVAVVSMIIGPGVGEDASGAGSSARVVVRGAGATFPAPLYEKWIMTFRRLNPDVVITYDVVGSGEGERRFLANAVDFGASDAALRDEQLARVRPGAQLVPVTAGMVVLAYNLPRLGGDLQLSRGVLADIFGGRIAMWDDPQIRADNPGFALPHRHIAPVVRQDGSGTTYAFAEHLYALSPAWREHGPGVDTLLELAVEPHVSAGERRSRRADASGRRTAPRSDDTKSSPS